MNRKILDRIKELFFTALEEKTNWGRNDVKELYNKCMVQALLEYIDAK